VVTIVAVFVALTVGILLGGALLSTGLTKDLEHRLDTLQSRVDERESQITDLKSERDQISSLVAAYLPTFLADRLSGVPATLVTIEDVDLSAVQAARQALEQAGATDLMTIQIKAKMSSNDPADQAVLARALGVSGDFPPADLPTKAAQELADRLVQVPGVGEPDLLLTLKSAGLISIVGQGGVTSIGVPGQTVTVVAGGTKPPAVEPATFLVPMIHTLVERTPVTPVVAAEPTDTTYAFVSLIRTGDLNGQVATVDHVDSVFGQISVAVGMQELIQDPGHGKNYGRDPGASAPFPAP
jgi:hypothetical protein